MELTDEIKKHLYCCGVDLIGISDMSRVENCNFKIGIAIAVALPENIIIDLQKAPTKEYYNLYYTLNQKLDDIVMAGEDFLINKGFETYAQTTERVKITSNKVSKLPHKRSLQEADLAGLGKIVYW